MITLSVDGQPQEIKGDSFSVEAQTLTTKQLVNLTKKQKRISAQLPSMCQPCQEAVIPPTPPPIIPTQSPNSLGPIAFWPTSTTTNSSALPPQTIGLTFKAANPGMNPSFNGTPPDTMGTIGPKQFILAINNGLVSFDRQGNRDGFLDTAPEAFLNLDGDFTQLAEASDVRIRYDVFSDRFFYITLCLSDFVGLAIAVSDSGIISDSTTWKVTLIYNITQIKDSQGCPGDQGLAFDQPTLGIDKHALYIAGDFFANGVRNTAFVVQKKSLLENGPVNITAFRNLMPVVDGFELRPVMGVDNFDHNPTFGYFINHTRCV